MAEIKGFELVEPPYSGGMAMVYEGRRGNFRKAFKLLRPDKAANNPKLSEMFLQEIQVQSRLCHPNIVTLLDAYQHEMPDGRRVTVLEMEWLNGLDLQSYIEKKNDGCGLDAETVKKIALQVICAMSYAHSQNILHLDLKPSNLFRTVEGYIKVIDFGIAKVVGENADIVEGAERVTMMTDSGENIFKGTLAFSAPEQQMGGTLRFSTDVFSFGQTLHYLLTGSTAPDVPVTDSLFRTIVDKCTQVNPFNRYQSFEEIRKELEAEPATQQCPNASCGRTVDASFRYCPYCQTELSGVSRNQQSATSRKYSDGAIDWTTEKICPHCKGRTSRTERLCNCCGKDTVITDTPQKGDERPPQTRSVHCERCNADNPLRADGKSRYCMKCGAILPL